MSCGPPNSTPANITYTPLWNGLPGRDGDRGVRAGGAGHRCGRSDRLQPGRILRATEDRRDDLLVVTRRPLKDRLLIMKPCRLLLEDGADVS